MAAPKYEVIKTCWLDQPDNRSETGFAPKLLRVGQKAPTIVRYEGWPNAALKPLDDEAKRRVAIVDEYKAAQRALPKSVEDHDKQARAEAKAKAKQDDKVAA